MPDYLTYFFWMCIFVVAYAYVGYGIVLFILVKIKALFTQNNRFTSDYTPDVTLLVAAYNEEPTIREKIENSLSLDYPRENIEYLFVTDGSDDKTPLIIKEYPEIKLMHTSERKGKIMAIQRAMAEVRGQIVVFTDANTLLNRDSIKNIVRHFSNEKVGVVSGEKRIRNQKAEEAAGAGEGLYWKYESLLKKWDDELYSVMGAAGELFAIRTRLFEKIPEDSLIEDFYLSLRIVQKGFKIAYEPEAYAMEEPSASVNEEIKRKIRIAAGGIQSVVRLRGLLNPFKYGVLTFQYISHRVLRWTLAPMALPIIFVVNLLLLEKGQAYLTLLVLQTLFYVAAGLGWLLEKRHLRFKLLFIPFYFCLMNFSVYLGFLRYVRGEQSVQWEKANRRISGF